PSYRANTSVQLMASPAAGWTFSHWSGAVEGTSRTVTVFMDADKSVTAHFVRLWNLVVRATTGGSVDREPNLAEYLDGTTVLLRATPDPYFRFIGWSGDVSGTTNPSELTMNADKQVIAQFVLTQ